MVERRKNGQKHRTIPEGGKKHPAGLGKKGRRGALNIKKPSGSRLQKGRPGCSRKCCVVDL